MQDAKKNLLRRIKENKAQKIFFWGASLFLEEFLRENSLDEFNIIGIVDKNSERWGKKLGKYEILQPDTLKNLDGACVICTIKNNNIEVNVELESYFIRKFPKLELINNIFGCFEAQAMEQFKNVNNTQLYMKRILEKEFIKPKSLSSLEEGIVKSFYDGIDKKNYIEKYKKLVSNLDEASVECVSTALSRVTQVAEGRKDILNSFTDEEIKQIDRLKEDFYHRILTLSESCYAYKQYLLPIKHFEPSVFYYKHHIELLKNLDKIRNKSIIDAGAFIGDSAIVLEDYTDKKVYSFEPTDENYDYMLRTIKLNDSKKIMPVKCALGDYDGEENICLNGSGSTINKLKVNSPVKETIQVIKLDDFVQENNIEVGLIKIDVEGYEQELLRGALVTIKEQKPTLLISIYHNADDFFNIKPYIESLNLNYKYRIVKPLDGSIKGEMLLIAEQ